LYFRKPGDPILPEAFKEESLAYGIAPYEWEHTGKIFFNEDFDRSNMLKPDGWHIYKVAKHEILHAFNLGHSGNPKDIMYYRYSMWSHGYEVSENTKSLFRSLY
jgi:hypothetical protein